MFGSIGCLALGSITLVNWGSTMFSDEWYADLLRAQSKTWSNLGRNTESVITPASGISFVFFGAGMLFYPTDADESSVGWLLGGGAAFFLFVAVLGLIPFRLPEPMYPEWQLERRRRRAQEAARASWEHEAGGVVPRGRHAARPEPTTGVGGHDGQYAGDAGGEEPLRSGDSLLVRARSPHDDDNGPGDGVNA